MPATAQHLLGQLADGRFPLRKLLGVSKNSAVFLSSDEPAHPGGPSPDVALKLIPEDPASSDLQLEHWRTAATLSHNGLLRILHFGRCTLDGAPCLYVVMELADEDLGQLLPRRALTPDEASGMLAAVLPTLDFLHENGFVHGGLKPSNIHATGDSVRLSADRIAPAGESATTWPLAAPFAAPEAVLFPASDMWSLGVSICETLTKVVPEQRPSGRFVLPELPAPYDQIVRSALVGDATLRITLDEVRSLLDPSFVAKSKTAPQESPLAAAMEDCAPRDSNGSVANESVDTNLNDTEPNYADSNNADPKRGSISSPYVRPPEAPDSPESLVEAVQPGAGRPSAPRSGSRQPLPNIDPLSVPLSPVSPKASPNAPVNAQPSRAPIPVSSLPQVNATIGSPRRVIAPHPTPRRSNKLFVASAAAALILAILFIPRFVLRSRNWSAPKATSSAVNSSPENSGGNNAATQPPYANSAPTNLAPHNKSNAAATTPPAASSKKSPSTISPAPNSGAASANQPSRTGGTSASPENGLGSGSGSASSEAPANTKLSTSPSPSLSTVANSAAPAIVHKVVPDISSKARSSIRGTVRVNVRVHINPDGSVSSAELGNPAPSQFFAAAALKAAKDWRFAPTSSANSPASAIIRFDFTPSSTSAYLP
jgi:TonB family protein